MEFSKNKKDMNSTSQDIKNYKKMNKRQEIWYRFIKSKSSVLGMILLILMLLMILSAPLIYDYNNDAIEQNISERLLPPFSEGHIFGTDDLGRDIGARLLFGGRLSISIGVISVITSLTLGGTLGAISGYYGGKIDNLIMRSIDIIMAIPMIMMAIVIIAALGTSVKNMIIALTITQIPVFARVTRGSVLTVRDMEYVEAAKAIGTKDSTIILEHIIPNALSPVIVQVAIRTAVSITNTAALSFLGLGVKAPTPEWGSMLSQGRAYIRDYSYMTFIPGMAMMITILSLNLLGDGLRDALDPRLK